MISLGIESTAHTLGIGIANDKKILANILKPIITETGGIIPPKAADHHVDVIGGAIEEALGAAKLSIKDVDIISFAQGPGIGHTLRVGAMAARTLALLYRKPLVGVNHCIGHLEIGKLTTAARDPVLLYVSGANTQIMAFADGKYRIFGETLDQGVGNMLDVFARHIGFGFPGGPKIMNAAKKGKNYIELPYVVKGMDVAFGGILTNASVKFDSGKYTKEDLCYSLQETVFSMLIEAAERAMAHTGKNELLLGGGVASNLRLQEMGRIMCKERGAKFYCPQRQYCVDNGSMVAYLGLLEYKKGNKTPPKDSYIKPYWRSDEV